MQYNQIQYDLKNINIDDINKNEKQRYLDAFVAYDKNGSKMIEREELKKLLEELGHNPSEEDITNMINEVDSTGRGAVSAEDFLRVIQYYKEKMNNSDEEEIKAIFVEFGGDDKNWTISRDKLEAGIQEYFDLSIDITRLIKELSSSAQIINYEDFKNLLQN